jgi:Ca2+-binding RTX toxin-like protein
VTPIRRTRTGVLTASVLLAVSLGPHTTTGLGANECDGLTPTILGTPGADEDLSGTPGPDVINALGGDDVIYGDDGDDVICAGEGSDSVNGGADEDRIFGEGGHDDLDGDFFDAGNDPAVEGDHIDGGAGDDFLRGREGDDESFGGPGNDLVLDFEGVDTMNGGPDSDTVDFSRSQVGVTVDLETETAETLDGEEEVVGFEEIFGSPHGDALFGDAEANLFDGEDGNDYMVGGGGIDTLSYLDPFDEDGPVSVDFEGNGLPGSVLGTSSGADGNDQFAEMEAVYGTPSGDVIRGDDDSNFLVGMGGNDLLDGRAGEDQAEFPEATGPLRASLAAGVISEPGGRTDLRSVENVAGTDFDDLLVGDAGDNALLGLEGDDKIYGRDGSDTLYGGEGNDGVFGGAGIFDLASFNDLDQGVAANLATGKAVSAGQTDDLFGIEGLEGSDYPDILTGDPGQNIFSGADGDDELNGGLAKDFIIFGPGLAGEVPGPAQVDLGAGTAVDESDGTAVQGDALNSIEIAAGTPLDDVLVGDSGDNLLFGFEGDDDIFGREGKDSLVGGEGDDLMDGEEDRDLVTYPFDPGVTLDLGLGTAESGGFVDELVSIEIAGGSPEKDSLTGTAGADFLIGDQGRDKLFGLAGEDVLAGGGFTFAEEGNPDSELIPISGRDARIDGGPDFDACVGKPQVDCETKDLTEEQIEILSVAQQIIDDIKRRNGVRVN